MQTRVSVKVDPSSGNGRVLLAPIGMPTPHQVPVGFAVDGGSFRLTGETSAGQMAAVITPHGGGPVTVTYDYAEGGPGYPDGLFKPRSSRFTRAADGLLRNARRIADTAADGHSAIEAIARDAAEKFVYGHPDTRFNDGHDEVPYISCDIAEGSCVDINTYLIATLRAAGFEAGYVTGYFFPQEKFVPEEQSGCCNDMHCWVVTRHNGVVLEWDIAHHLKLGTRAICCGLNPKPGERVAVAHSMGLDFPELGIRETKLLGEPAWVNADGTLADSMPDIRLFKIVENKVDAA